MVKLGFAVQRLCIAFLFTFRLIEVRTRGEEECTQEKGWSEVAQSTEGVQLFERALPEVESLTLLKAIGDIKGATPADILAFTLEGDLEKRKEFDPDLLQLEVVKEVKPTLQVTRTEVAAPYPVSTREFLDMRTWVEGDDRIIFGARTINLEGAPHNEEAVRCLLYTSPSPRDQRGSRMPSSA